MLKVREKLKGHEEYCFNEILHWLSLLILPTQVYKDGEKVLERRTERRGARAVSM